MSIFSRKMSERIERRFAALDLGDLEPIRGMLFSYSCENAFDAPTTSQLQCVIGTAEAYIDAPADYEWIAQELEALEALAERKNNRY